MLRPPDPPPLQSIESADALYTRVLARGRRLRRERRAFLLTAGMSLLLLAAAVPVALTNDDPAQLATTDRPTTTRRATTTTFQYTLEPNPNAVTTTTPTTSAPVVAGATVTTARSTARTTRSTAPRRRSSSPTTARPTTTRQPTPTSSSTSTSTTVIPASRPASACSGPASVLPDRPLAFVRDGDVWVVEAAGAIAITNTRVIADPSWAPDAARLVVEGPAGLYVVARAGGSATLVTGTTGGDTDPAWSPDGGRIAFVRGGNILTVPAGGGQASLVMHQDAPLGSPTWSPNSCDLAFTWKTWVLKARSSDGTGVSRVHDLASQPSWGYGDRLAVATSEDIRLVNPNGSNSTPLGTPGATQPTWKADASAVAFKVSGGIGSRTVSPMGPFTPVAGTAAGDTDPAW